MRKTFAYAMENNVTDQQQADQDLCYSLKVEYNVS